MSGNRSRRGKRCQLAIDKIGRDAVNFGWIVNKNGWNPNKLMNPAIS